MTREGSRNTVKRSRRVVELFAGVGGFRLGLEASNWQTVWANQWEPSTKVQHAALCYESHWPDGRLVVGDIHRVLNQIEQGESESIPDHELLVGGFPCQDYSVARTLSHATGLAGKKGVLWWEINRILQMKQAPFVLLENVDRLLKSPASQRGRDFAVILSCLASLGYVVEWRVVNAADYGFPQRRRRVFILARPPRLGEEDPVDVVFQAGVLAEALPLLPPEQNGFAVPESIPSDLLDVSERFGRGNSVTPFRTAGFMRDFKFWTFDGQALHRGRRKRLGHVLLKDESRIPAEFYIQDSQLGRWEYLKGAKREQRTNASGYTYFYSEGKVDFPDDPKLPSRTILTGEGGPTPSRFKHVVPTADGRLRRLLPEELEKLNGFRSGWTDTGMSASRRAFMMGNALVVGVVERIGQALDHQAEELIQAR